MELQKKIFGDLQLANYYNVSRSTISRLKKAGKIPFGLIGSRRYFYYIDDLDNVFYHSLKGGERE